MLFSEYVYCSDCGVAASQLSLLETVLEVKFYVAVV